MGSTNYVLKCDGICCCDQHKKKVRNHLNTIDGVKIIGEIDIDNGRCKVNINISGTVDPNTVIKEFQKLCKMNNVELILSEKSPTPPTRDYQEKQIVRPPQGHGISNTALDKSTSWKKTNACDHPKLKLIRYNKRFTCDKCKEDGFGSRYRCEQQNCAYELHAECKNPNPTKTIELFNEKSITFEFHYSAPYNYKPCCDACGKYIHGCFYKAVNSNLALNLHPRCSSLGAQIPVYQDIIFQVRKNVSLIRCLWCNNDKSRGWSYVSNCNKYHFHLCCVTEMLHEAWKGGDLAAVDDTDVAISKALTTIDLKLTAKSKKNGDWKSTAVWKIVKIFLKTIISICLGDPTGLVVGLLTN